MALTVGTNCGFVSTAPTADPSDGVYAGDGFFFSTKDTSPATAGKITEVGWYANVLTADRNFEVGLYAADGATVPGEAGTLLQSSRTNSSGTTAGWIKVAVDWSIKRNTIYWLGLQIDYVSPSTATIQASTTNGVGADAHGPGQTTLADPCGEGAIALGSGCVALYALWEAGTVFGPNNLKTYNTNTEANIKTINTNPIANVKSLNTNV